jgi:hypothetical protein
MIQSIGVWVAEKILLATANRTAAVWLRIGFEASRSSRAKELRESVIYHWDFLDSELRFPILTIRQPGKLDRHCTDYRL